MEKAYWRRKLPPGFQFWMENLGRSVVYAQPENIYEHAAKYLEEKLMERNMALERLPKNSYLQQLAVKKSGRKSKHEVSKDDENEAIIGVDDAKAESAHTFRSKKSLKEQNAKSAGAITSQDIPSSSQLQQTAGDESGRETPIEVSNAVARTLQAAQEQCADDNAAMEEQAETESQEDAHESHEKTLLLESSQVKVSDQDLTSRKGSSGTNSDEAQSVAYSEENQDSGQNDFKDEDINISQRNSLSKRGDEAENIIAIETESTRQQEYISDIEKSADEAAIENGQPLAREHSVSSQENIPDSGPVVPVVEAGPVVPIVEAGPVVPVVEAGPVVPVVEAGTVVPVAEAGPNVPIGELSPNVSAVESSSVVPAAESSPVVSSAESGPVVSTAESGPVVPAAESGPVVPAAESGPVVSTAESGPVVTAAESGPVVPAAESGPVVPATESGPVVPVAESGPVVPAAESGPVVPPAESGPVVPPAESGPDVPPAESGQDVPPAETGAVMGSDSDSQVTDLHTAAQDTADESSKQEEEMMAETKSTAEQVSSQTAGSVSIEDSNEEEQTVEVGVVSCSVEAVVTTGEDSEQPSGEKGDGVESGGEGGREAEEQSMEDRKDSHQALMKPTESVEEIEQIEQIADSIDIITHHEEAVKDEAKSPDAESVPAEEAVQPSEETESNTAGTSGGTDTQENLTETDGKASDVVAESTENGGGETGEPTNTDTGAPTETNQDAPTIEDQLPEDDTTAGREDHTPEVPAAPVE